MSVNKETRLPTIVETIPLLNSVRDCSKISNISRSELYRRIGDGRLAAVYVGAFMRVTREALLKMIAELPKVGE